MSREYRVTPSRIDLVDLVAHVGPLVRVAHLAHAALALAVAVSLAPSVAVVALVDLPSKRCREFRSPVLRFHTRELFLLCVCVCVCMCARVRVYTV